MKNILSLCFLLLAIGVAHASPVSVHGALSVKDGQIVDKNGNPPQLRGMSLFWDIYSEGSTFYNSTTIGHLANTWKASVVRASIGGGSVSNAKTIIDAAIANGMYVIVDWHKHQIETDNAKNFFSEVSSYVKNNHANAANVIYEIYNEPINDSWSSIKSYAESVIPVIRNNSPSNLIIVGTPSYSSVITAPIGGTLDAPVLFTQTSNFVSGSNIAYAVHFYASDVAHEKYQGYITKARCAGVPMFITEWGLSAANGTGTLNYTLIKKWVSFIENSKLSWAAWSIANKDESSAAMKTQTGPGDVGTQSKWSPSGVYLQGLMSALNNGGSHVDVSSSTINCPTSSSSSVFTPGGGDVANRIEAENYTSTIGTTSMNLSSASGGAYLGSITEGGSTIHWITSSQDQDMAGFMKVRTSSKGTVHWSIGSKSGQWTLLDGNASGNWSYFKFPISIPAGKNDLTMSFTGFNGNVDWDWMSFQPVTQGDSVDFGYLAIDSLGNIYVPILANHQRPISNQISGKIHSGKMELKADGRFWKHVELRSVSGAKMASFDLSSSLLSHKLELSSQPAGVMLLVARDYQGHQKTILLATSK